MEGRLRESLLLGLLEEEDEDLGIRWLAVGGDRRPEGVLLDERGEAGRYIDVWDVLSKMCAVWL